MFEQIKVLRAKQSAGEVIDSTELQDLEERIRIVKEAIAKLDED